MKMVLSWEPAVEAGGEWARPSVIHEIYNPSGETGHSASKDRVSWRGREVGE